jgi:hypothetical protein
MNGDGALGSHGYGGHFYHHLWDIVGSYVISHVQEFFNCGVLI